MAEKYEFIKLAALWKKTNDKGTVYLSGVLEEEITISHKGGDLRILPGNRINVLKNKNKNNEKQPDHTVFLVKISE